MFNSSKGFSMSMKIVMVLVMGVVAAMIVIAMLSGTTSDAGGLRNLTNTSSGGLL